MHPFLASAIELAKKYQPPFETTNEECIKLLSEAEKLSVRPAPTENNLGSPLTLLQYVLQNSHVQLETVGEVVCSVNQRNRSLIDVYGILINYFSIEPLEFLDLFREFARGRNLYTFWCPNIDRQIIARNSIYDNHSYNNCYAGVFVRQSPEDYSPDYYYEKNYIYWYLVGKSIQELCSSQPTAP